MTNVSNEAKDLAARVIGSVEGVKKKEATYDNVNKDIAAEMTEYIENIHHEYRIILERSGPNDRVRIYAKKVSAI